MNGENEENLNELFAKFLSAEQAERAVEDVEKAEQILGGHAAPEPDDMLIAEIKAEIAMGLLPRKADVFKRMVYKTAVVAAAVIVVSVISVRLLDKGGHKSERTTYDASIIPEALWATDDVELAIFTAEIEQIEGEVLTLQLIENGVNGQADIAELEMELIAIDSDFWKG